MRRLVKALDALIERIHAATCPLCKRGASRVVVGGERRCIGGRKPLPIDRILIR